MATSDTNVERKIAPIYIVQEGEIILDASVKDAWRHVINYPSWQNYSIVQHVSGNPGQEGEVVLLKKEEGNFTTTPYFARTIKLDPGYRVIWKTFREGVNGFGIVEFKVYERDGKTRFYHNTVYEHNVLYQHEAELDVFRKNQYENFEALSTSIFVKLKELVERSA